MFVRPLRQKLVRFFRFTDTATAIQHKKMEIQEDQDYSKFTKSQLIRRILDLEGKTPNAKEPTPEKASVPKKKKAFDFNKYSTRFVALRFAYLGWNYSGLAVQRFETPLPTVEFCILEALQRSRLIATLTPQDCGFSRCGRTDRGVSAMNQVISLKVRSNLTPEEQQDPTNDARELDYVTILNSILPSDIRMSAVSLRPPPKFDARFSCLSRHYKYIFRKEGLDLDLMRQAAAKFEGEHDFRNFCKVDGSKQITNYKRTMMSAKIEPLSGSEDLMVFDLQGTAFLWHQVRCMMAIMLLVGQKLEKPDIVDYLTNIAENPQKPVYEIANDIPLLLYNCYFPEMEWKAYKYSPKNVKSSNEVYGIVTDYQIKSAVSQIMKDITTPSLEEEQMHGEGRVRVNLGNGKGRIVGKYVPLREREVMIAVEEANEKWKKKRKFKEE